MHHDECLERNVTQGTVECQLEARYEWEIRDGAVVCLSEPEGCPGVCGCDKQLVERAKEILGDGDCPTVNEQNHFFTFIFPLLRSCSRRPRPARTTSSRS